MKQFNFTKEQQRGALKQIMKVRGLRTISLANYLNWKKTDENSVYPAATIKLNLQDGYLNMFDLQNNKLDNEQAASLYDSVFNLVSEIFENEMEIPYKYKRNILVKINR